MGSSKPDRDEAINNLVRAAAQNIFTDPEAASLKLVAWAYGAIRKDSEEETLLLALLKKKLGTSGGPKP